MMAYQNRSEARGRKDISFAEAQEDVLKLRTPVRNNTDPSSLATLAIQPHDNRIGQTVAVNGCSLTRREALDQPLPPSALKSDREKKKRSRVEFGGADAQQLLPNPRVQFSVPSEPIQTKIDLDTAATEEFETSPVETESQSAPFSTPADSIFFQPLSNRKENPVDKRYTQHINIVVVNLVVGNEDKTWTSVPSLGSPEDVLRNNLDVDNEATQSLREAPKVQNVSISDVGNMRGNSKSIREDGTLLTGLDEPERGSIGALPNAPLDNKPINWLLDDGMLCHAIPEAQVFQFGYRLGPAPESLTSEFYERVSQELRQQIEKRIDLKGSPKIDQDSTNPHVTLKGPIIFIAYGDAGIVLEIALTAAHEEFEQTLKSEKDEIEKILEADADSFEDTVESNTRQLGRARLVTHAKELQSSLKETSELLMACKKRASISYLTAGVIFLGTPFLGSNRFAKHLGKLIGRATTPAEQEYMGSKSKSLEALLRRFKNVYTSLGMPTWFFRASDMVSMHKSNIFKGNSTDLLLNCASISKFSGHEDLNYLQVLEKLMEFNNLRQLLDAASEGRLDIVQQLTKKGVDVNLTNGLGSTALHESVKNNHGVLVEWLLRYGNADVEIANKDGNTALRLAVMKRSVIIVRLLLESGANVKVKNLAKKSALDIARKNAGRACWQETPEQTHRDWRNDPIYWQLTHRPFLVEPDPALTKKFPTVPNTPSDEALEACNHHTITAVEFFLGKRPRPERRSVFRMIYSKNSSPTATLDHARDLAIANLKKAKENPGDSGVGLVNAAIESSANLSSVARWYHLPAHNMSWVKDFFIKMRLDVPSSAWTSQKHDSPHPHKRFMRPFAKTIQAQYNDKEKKIVAFCMPFLDYETTSGRVKMAEVAKNAVEKDRLKRSQNERMKRWLQKMEKDVTEYMKRNIEDTMKKFSSPRPQSGSAEGRPRTQSDSEACYDNEGRREGLKLVTSNNSHNGRGSVSESSNGRWDSGDMVGTTDENKSVATSNKSNDNDDEVLNIEFKAAKKLIIHGYLTHDLPLLLRRTLDQYYYCMLLDTEDRDRDQVVFRHKRDQLDYGLASSERRQRLKKIKIVMVDQLWLWFVPKGDGFQYDTILSCFPKRWCQNKPEDPDLLESMLNFEGKAPPISSVYDLITMITSKCANIFDRSSAPDDCQFLEFFESAIGSAADKEKQLFETFRDLSRKLSGNKRNRHTKDRVARAKDLDQFLNIDDETQLLIVVKDIQDEISTILLVLNDQLTVLKNIITAIKSLHLTPSWQTFDENKCLESHQMIANNIRDFEKMASQAQKTNDSLSHLLELKSRQANAWEARFAREGSEEAARQGTTVLVFTVVTIIFLPLSFMASFMALNVVEFPKDQNGITSWHLSTASAFVFGITFAIAIPLIIIAFNVTIVRDFLRTHISENLKRTLKISRTTTHLWMSTISPSAWLSKTIDLIEDHSSFEKIPEPMRKWKAKEKENFRKWTNNLRNKEKEEILWQAKMAQVEMDEKAIYEDYKTSSEDEGEDRGRTESELIEESEGEVSSDANSTHSNQSTWRKLKGGAKQGKGSLMNTLRARIPEARGRDSKVGIV